MAKSRSQKRSQSAASAEHRVLPMELQVGDGLTDETGEWEIIAFVVCGWPGKNVHARMKKVGQPDVTEIKTCAARERVNVNRVG